MSPNSSQSSFIPKRGLASPRRRKPTKKIFLFSIIAYSLIFASLLASGASYLYKNYVTTLLQNEVSQLNTQIDTFSVGDLGTIAEFDLTLQRANDRFKNTVSVVAALDAIDRATAEPVQIQSLTMERSGDQELILTANIATQSFDSALFQRKILNADQRIFSDVSVTDVVLAVAAVEEAPAVLVDQPVTFTATLRVPIDVLGPAAVPSASAPAPAPAAAVTNQSTI